MIMLLGNSSFLNVEERYQTLLFLKYVEPSIDIAATHLILVFPTTRSSDKFKLMEVPEIKNDV